MRYLFLLTALPTGPTIIDDAYSYATPDNSTSVDPHVYTSTYGTKHLVKRGHVICQTGKNSPLIEHIDISIKLDHEAGSCKQSNHEGRCKMVINGGDAEMFICGPFPQILVCKEIARGIKEVRNRCDKDGRAAGEWDFLGTGINARVGGSAYQLAADGLRQSDYV